MSYQFLNYICFTLSLFYGSTNTTVHMEKRHNFLYIKCVVLLTHASVGIYKFFSPKILPDSRENITKIPTQLHKIHKAPCRVYQVSFSYLLYYIQHTAKFKMIVKYFNLKVVISVCVVIHKRLVFCVLRSKLVSSIHQASTHKYTLHLSSLMG